MKKALLIIAAVLGTVFLAILVLPWVFRDKISAQVSAILNEKISGTAYYDPEGISLSLYQDFPDLTFSMKRFGVVGVGDFKGDTLVHAEEFAIAVDLLTVFRSQGLEINSIFLDSPVIRAVVLSNGHASWDIMKPDTAAAAQPEAKPTPFSIKIKSWQIRNGEITYFDMPGKTYAHISGLQHAGNGNLAEQVFDLQTQTSVEALTLDMDSVNYLNNRKFEAKMDLAMDMAKSEYRFKDNLFRINDFGFGFDGSIAMPDTNIRMDITWSAKETDFKNLLSLIPAMYTASFADLKASGTVAFSGSAKGIFNAKSLPAFTLNLQVKDGMFQYPKLPSAVTDVQMDMVIANPGHTLETIQTELKNLSLKIGANPVSLQWKTAGLSSMQVNGKANARLDLTEISKAFPMEGLTLKGLLSIAAQAQGQYSDSMKLMPKMTADLKLLDGYVKSDKLPAPLEQVNATARIDNPDGQIASTVFTLSQLRMMLEGAPFAAKARVWDFADYHWDMEMKGRMDLEKLTKLFPIADTKLAGIMEADIKTQGAMSDVTASRYDRLPTSGTMRLNQFRYQTKDQPEVKISQAAMQFDPKAATLSDCKGQIASSDFDMKGQLTNYIAWVMNKGTLKGQLELNSQRMHVNELMPAPATPPAKGQEAPMAPIAVPTNLDLAFEAKVADMKYDNMQIKDCQGRLLVKDGTLRMEQLRFNTLEGSIAMNGLYDPRDLLAPKYDFQMDVKGISIPQAYSTFNTVQQLAPIAKNLSGKASTKMHLTGTLDQQMKPILPSLNGEGMLQLAEGQLQSFSMMQGVNNLTKLNLPASAIALKDLLLQLRIENGRVTVKPFDLNVGGTQLNLGGSQSFDGKMDYIVKVKVPAGLAGQAASGVIASLTGKSLNVAQSINLNIGVGGLMSAPQYKLLGASGGSLKTEAKAAVSQQLNDAKARAQAEADRLRQEAETRARAEADRLRQEAEARARAEAERLKQEAKKRAQDEIRRRLGL